MNQKESIEAIKWREQEINRIKGQINYARNELLPKYGKKTKQLMLNRINCLQSEIKRHELRIKILKHEV